MSPREILILKLPKQVQIDMLKTALKEDKMDIFLTLSNILLDTPLDRGRLETETIHNIYNTYHKPKK